MQISLLVDSSSHVFGIPIDSKGEPTGEPIQLTDGVYSCTTAEEQYTEGTENKPNLYTTVFNGQLVLVEIPDDQVNLFW